MVSLPRLQDPSLVDLAVLRDLALQFDDPAVTLQFVHTFVDLWESRYARLATALGPFDRDAVLDTLLSIKASSAMSGAVRLSKSAREMECVVVSGDIIATAGMLTVVKVCGEETMRELREHYIKPAETR